MANEAKKISTLLPPDVQFNGQISRRELTTLGTKVALYAAGLGFLGGSLKFLWPNTNSTANQKLLGFQNDFRVGTITWLASNDLFVIRTESGVAAVSSRCTHLGCTVRRTANGFSCPCHGAKYDLDGNPTSGPTKIALPWFEIQLDAKGRLWVHPNIRVPIGSFASLTPQIHELPK